MVNLSIDMQVYNDSKQQSKNLLVYNSKTTVAFYNFFDLKKYGKLTNKYIPNKHSRISKFSRNRANSDINVV